MADIEPVSETSKLSQSNNGIQNHYFYNGVEWDGEGGGMAVTFRGCVIPPGVLNI